MIAAETSEMKQYDIAIVGGGLGGVILAIGLLKHGIPVKIYEAAKSFGEIGAGVAFGPNAMRAFGFVSPELLEAFRRHATYNESPERGSTVFTFVRGEDSADGDGKIGDFMFDLKNEQDVHSWTRTMPRGCVHRAKFLNEIIKLVPDGIATFNKSLSGLEEIPESEGGGVRMQFADGTSAFASAVIGCDGIKSKTRQFLHGDKVKPVYTGEYAYRALIPVEAYEECIGHDFAVNGHIYPSHGRYIVSYPVGEGIINIAVLIKNPNWEQESWLGPTSEEEMRSDMRGMHPGFIELAARFSSRDKWAMHDMVHSEKYCKGRVCLLGDSAHASTPHMAGGAGQAVEDAYVLSNLLSKTQNAEDLPKVFEAYDAVRRPRTQQVIKYSRMNGLAFSLQEEGVGDDQKVLQEHVTARWKWLWDEDLEKHLQDAFDLIQ